MDHRSNSLSNIKSIIPVKFRKSFRRALNRIKPPRILLTDFVPQGCQFEISCDTEKSRVQNLGQEAEFLHQTMDALSPDDIFYDIGSCVGLYAIQASMLGARVIAFEPDPSYRKRLHRNIKINKQQKSIRVIDWAVSDQDGRTTLFTNGVSGSSPSLTPNGVRDKVSVKTRSIDRAISDKELLAPTVVKMDIEGAEILALKGMGELLGSSSAPKLIFIELHPKLLSIFGSSINECIQIIESSGYRKLNISKRSNEVHCIFIKNHEQI